MKEEIAMANVIYTRFFEQISNGSLAFNTANIACLLTQSSSTYAANKTHDFVADVFSNGGVECNTGGYARTAVANKTVTIDDPNSRVELKFNNVSFGNLSSGQTVEAIIVYVNTGSDATSSLICHIDNATGLPAVLGGGEFLITVNAEGLIQLAQA